jgi:nucleoside-diphosphate-sugar epimerase
MKLTVIAATGGAGRQVLERAVAAGRDVPAVVRNPARPTRPARAITADLAPADPAVLEPAIGGADAVLSGLGPHSNADAGIAAPGTRTITAAMRASGTSAPSAPPQSTPQPPKAGQTRPSTTGDGFLMRYVLSRVASAALGKVNTDLALMGDAPRDSGLDWTVLRPPRMTGKHSFTATQLIGWP